MPIGKSDLKRWVYDFDCTICANLKIVNDPQRHRSGLYCIPTILANDSGKRWEGVHADDDRHLRCDYFEPKST